MGREERRKHDLLTATTAINNKQSEITKQQSKESDSDSTDSSLYSSSDSNDDESNELDAISASLTEINDSIQNNKLKDMDIQSEQEEEQGLIHQDTPYKLNFSKELIAENQIENDEHKQHDSLSDSNV